MSSSTFPSLKQPLKEKEEDQGITYICNRQDCLKASRMRVKIHVAEPVFSGIKVLKMMTNNSIGVKEHMHAIRQCTQG